MNLLNNLTNGEVELIKLPKKPPSPDHPWRRKIKDWQTKKISDLNSERNSRWLNEYKPLNYTSVLWTKELYSIDELEEYGYKIDKDHGKVEKLKSNKFLKC